MSGWRGRCVANELGRWDVCVWEPLRPRTLQPHPSPPLLPQVDNVYAYNFVPKNVQVKLDTLGPRKARHTWAHPEAKADTFVNYRHTRVDAWRPAAGQTAAAWTSEGAPKPFTKSGGWPKRTEGDKHGH